MRNHGAARSRPLYQAAVLRRMAQLCSLIAMNGRTYETQRCSSLMYDGLPSGPARADLGPPRRWRTRMPRKKPGSSGESRRSIRFMRSTRTSSRSSRKSWAISRRAFLPPGPANSWSTPSATALISSGFRPRKVILQNVGRRKPAPSPPWSAMTSPTSSRRRCGNSTPSASAIRRARCSIAPWSP